MDDADRSFIRGILGVIILFLIFLTLTYYGIDGWLIYAVISYVAFLSGWGLGLFFDRKIREKRMKFITLDIPTVKKK